LHYVFVGIITVILHIQLNIAEQGLARIIVRTRFR
jgi:hypothetical protein